MKYAKLLAAFIIFLASCKSNDKKTDETHPTPSGIKEINTTYTLDSVTMNGFVAYDSANTDKRPVVLIIHEWWGLNDYSKMRARELAKLGYLAFAIDLYGNGKRANDPEEAQNLSAPFYADPQMTKARFDAALAKIKSYPEADASKIASIGYCFGGAMCLNLARLGEDLKGVVSFHGNLVGVTPDKTTLKAKILVCRGDADKFVLEPEAAQFTKQMDSVKADYTVKVYPGATHSFTNPEATAIGKKFSLPLEYNAAADSASWKDMQEFFVRIFK